jgi:hypothetical protein
MSDPGFLQEMASLQADLAGRETAFVPHEEVERRLAQRFGRERGG